MGAAPRSSRISLSLPLSCCWCGGGGGSPLQFQIYMQTTRRTRRRPEESRGGRACSVVNVGCVFTPCTDGWRWDEVVGMGWMRAGERASEEEEGVR